MSISSGCERDSKLDPFRFIADWEKWISYNRKEGGKGKRKRGEKSKKGNEKRKKGGRNEEIEEKKKREKHGNKK